MKKPGRPKGTTKGGLRYLDEGQLKAFFRAIRQTKDAGRKTRDDLIFSLIVFYGHKRVSSSERYFEQVQFKDTGKKMEGIFGDIL